jgi:hypothetical protein
MTIFAYIIVIVISQFVLTAGVILTGLILGLVLTPIPERLRMSALGFIGGAVGAVLVVQVAQLLFAWLAGPGSFGWGPYLAAVVPLSIPIWNDYGKFRQLREVQGEAPPRVAEFAAPSTAAMGTMPLGALAGIILSAFLFL